MSYNNNTILEKMRGRSGIPDKVENGKLYLPDWDIEITPRLQKADPKSAYIVFEADSPDWDISLTEGSADMGENTETAIDNAVMSYMNTFVDGLGKMKKRREFGTVITRYNNAEHRFRVWNTMLVGKGMGGQSAPKDSGNVYWEILKTDIARRLGNQKICVIKIYASKNGDNVICECRINNEISREMTEKVSAYAKTWKTDGFSSEKQYIFIEQQEKTFVPHKYPKAEKNEEFRDKVDRCIQLIDKAETKKDYDKLYDRMCEAAGDRTLAAECQLMLPEIMARHAYANAIDFPEYIDLTLGKKGTDRIYCCQLYEFYPLKNVALDILSHSVDGEKTFRKLVALSSANRAIGNGIENGAKLENIRMTACNIIAGEDFELR